MKTMICIRHGRTAWNAMGRFQGVTDIPLDDVGREQVRATAELLRDVACSYAVSSDLQRARESLGILIEGRNLIGEIDVGFRERGFGRWEGLTWNEITELEPSLLHTGIHDNRVFLPENGEAFECVKSRVFAAYERALMRIKDGETAFMVAHAGVLHALLDVLFGPERETTLIMPAGAFVVRTDGERVSFEGISAK
jgi:broad specificity phosphatase PhoE